MKILLEAMTEPEWVARCLGDLGHEVIVADPNCAAMYATRSRRVKTDRRDAVTLADACRLGAYRVSHRASDRQRHVRAELAVCETLVRTRVKCVGWWEPCFAATGFTCRAGRSTGSWLGCSARRCRSSSGWRSRRW